MQKIIKGEGSLSKLEEFLNSIASEKFLLVCDSAFDFLDVRRFFENPALNLVRFSDFTPNPQYDDVAKGVEIFNKENCDTIVAIGGGSAIDVAKCIKLFCKMKKEENYLQQEFSDSGVPLIAIPTTAGTGSESTRYAVIYFEGVKQSVTHESIVPNFAILDPNLLKTLPPYQKKCTMLDALCQGIESWWSVNSTDESKDYSKKAVELIIKNYKEYIFGDSPSAAAEIINASNLTGKAINIAQTTAAHAMSYKMTSLYKISHGHAVAIGLPHIWDYMLNHGEDCVDPRGKDYLWDVFHRIAKSMGQENPESAIAFFRKLLKELEIYEPSISDEELKILSDSVNPTRLKNNPVALRREEIPLLYKRIGEMK